MIINRTVFPPIAKFIRGFSVVDVECEKCGETLYLSEKEREMKHKELVEIFRVVVAGSISLTIAIVIYAFDKQRELNPVQLGGLALMVILIFLAFFNMAFEKIRTDIRVIQAMHKVKRK